MRNYRTGLLRATRFALDCYIDLLFPAVRFAVLLLTVFHILFGLSYPFSCFLCELRSSAAPFPLVIGFPVSEYYEAV